MILILAVLLAGCHSDLDTQRAVNACMVDCLNDCHHPLVDVPCGDLCHARCMEGQ